MKKILLSICLLVFSVISYSQTGVFKILIVKKAFLIKSSENIALSYGKQLKINDVISIKEGGYVGLFHISGSRLELKKAGVYNVNELVKQINTKQVGFAKKYAQFALDKMTSTANSESVNYDITGSVTRGEPSKKEKTIKIIAPDEVRVLKEKETLLKWHPISEINTYEITLMNLDNNLVFNKEVKSNSMMIDFSKMELEGNEQFILQVNYKENSTKVSSQCVINMVSDKEALELKEELIIMNQNLNEGSALDNLIMASYFEEKQLFLNALYYYDKAMLIGKGVEGFNDAYTSFLKRQF